MLLAIHELPEDEEDEVSVAEEQPTVTKTEEIGDPPADGVQKEESKEASDPAAAPSKTTGITCLLGFTHNDFKCVLEWFRPVVKVRGNPGVLRYPHGNCWGYPKKQSTLTHNDVNAANKYCLL